MPEIAGLLADGGTAGRVRSAKLTANPDTVRNVTDKKMVTNAGKEEPIVMSFLAVSTRTVCKLLTLHIIFGGARRRRAAGGGGGARTKSDQFRNWPGSATHRPAACSLNHIRTAKDRFTYCPELLSIIYSTIYVAS